MRSGLIILLMSVMPAGCTGPAINPHAHSTFLNSRDLVNMTDRMAASIASDPIIAQITMRHPMVIVLTPLKNDTNELIPRDQGDTFLHRVRVLLTAQQSLRRRFEFVLNPATFNRLQKQEQISPAQLGPPAGRVLPQYALQATFYADTKVEPKYRSDYYLCTFFLNNIHSGHIIWEGSYETKKAIHSSFLY